MKPFRRPSSHRRRAPQPGPLHPLERAEAMLRAALESAPPRHVGLLAARLAAVSEKLELQRLRERRSQFERAQAVREQLGRRALDDRIAEMEAEFAGDPAYTAEDFREAAEYQLAHPD